MAAVASSKCVHKGCGKVFSDADEPCVYHPGPPVFHEGQKGWECCKPRVLTFDEFMTIPPCTTGKHSVVDDTPKPVPKPSNAEVDAQIAAQQAKAAASTQPAIARNPIAAPPPQSTSSPALPPEDEDDDPEASIPDNTTCRRKSCGKSYRTGQDRTQEQCVYHPGQALFHEGSKGWTCCKRRVLEFDEFMKIPGCTTKPRHLFVGRQKLGEQQEEQLNEIRSDFYQTATTVIASMYLKKIEKDRSTVKFVGERSVELDLHTNDRKHYERTIQLYGAIDADKSSFKIMGTKLELTLAKADGTGWPVLKADDRHTGEIIQAGRAGRV